ncbi:MAG: ABC transporter substrate-binding protein [Chloroflexi bacterium]|nr:ABC transporter substrate-binding protein [Chloroflexota bacterium]
MSKLRLNLACRFYDRTAPLIDGRVQPEGIDLNYIQVEPYEIFWRMLHHSEFDVAECSTSGYFITLERSPAPYIAIPVFPSKMFRHAAIYINTNSGIKQPKDLEGRRVGGPEFSQTAALWARGILQDEYGVDLTKVQWFRGGLEAPDPVERVELSLPPTIHLEEIEPGKSLNAMLEGGELDAVISPQPEPSSFRRGVAHVQRLFPNFRDVEMAYYAKTKLFPIMHSIVIKRSIYEEHPWIASSLMKAFEEAKNVCYGQLVHTGVLSAALPWLHWHLEEEYRFFGRDPFAYGVHANRGELETLVRYSFEQGLTHELVDIDRAFAPEASDMFNNAIRYGSAGPVGPLRFTTQGR